MNEAAAYSVVDGALSGCCVVDDLGNPIAKGRYEAACLIAALMNGDYRAVSTGTDKAAAECREMLRSALRPMRGAGRPGLPTAFPLL
jgi:hypothetical protein